MDAYMKVKVRLQAAKTFFFLEKVFQFSEGMIFLTENNHFNIHIF